MKVDHGIPAKNSSFRGRISMKEILFYNLNLYTLNKNENEPKKKYLLCEY